jgi:hypothetical protein
MSNSNESEQNSHLAIVPLSSNREETIEAEILEETSIQKKRRRSKRHLSDKPPASLRDRTVSIVPLTNSLILEGECIETAQRTEITPSKPQNTRQTIITSPWTAASLIVVFAANIAIGVSYWNNASQKVTQLTPPATQLPKPSASSPSPSPSIDLASEASDNLNLKSLSIVKPGATAVVIQPVKIPSAPPAQVAQTAPSPSNLSQALIPPALQPQTVPTGKNTPSPAPTVVVPIPQVSSLPPPPILEQTATPTTQPPQTQPLQTQNNQPLLETLPTLSEENSNSQSSNLQTRQPSRGKDDRSALSYYQRKRAESRSRSTPQDLEALNQQLQNIQQQPKTSSQTNNTQPTIEIQPPVGSNTQQPNSSQTNNTQPTIEIQPPVSSNTQQPNSSQTNNTQPTIEIQPPVGSNTQQPNSSQTNNTQPTIEIQPPVGGNIPQSDRFSVEKKPDGSIEIRSKGMR